MNQDHPTRQGELATLPKEFDFVPRARTFQWTNAVNCASAALLAYHDEETIVAQAEGTWKMDARFIDSGESTQAFAMTNDELVLVAFRGTKELDDLYVDADAHLVPGPLVGKVHRGFFDALNEVWTEVERAILDFGGLDGKAVWFTGHSLGAALAGLATATLLTRQKPVFGLYAFGQPRIGNWQFVDRFDELFKDAAFRFVNNNDFVTRVPPRLAGYSHAGTFRYFDAGGAYHETVTHWERFLDRIQGRMDNHLQGGPDGVVDHSMLRYLELVKAASSS